jgi:hypothetical protein
MPRLLGEMTPGLSYWLKAMVHTFFYQDFPISVELSPFILFAAAVKSVISVHPGDHKLVAI